MYSSPRQPKFIGQRGRPTDDTSSLFDGQCLTESTFGGRSCWYRCLRGSGKQHLSLDNKQKYDRYVTESVTSWCSSSPITFVHVSDQGLSPTEG